ncbi:MAG: hypothetical protein F4X98_11335 [Gammaproteobacteria bacterium]|nr:hypothetical protein [Gammaproteobacteria bacterium]
MFLSEPIRTGTEAHSKPVACRRVTLRIPVLLAVWCAVGALEALAGDARDVVFECPCSGVWEAGTDGTQGEFTMSFGLRSHRAVDSNELRLTNLSWFDRETHVGMALLGALEAREVLDEQRVEIVLQQAPPVGQPIQFVLWERLGDVGPNPEVPWIVHEHISLWPVSDDRVGSVDYVDILTDTDGDGVGDVNERIAGTAANDDTSTPPGLSEIDVLVLYNDGVRKRFGGYPHARLHHSMAVTRALFADQGTGIKLRTVGMSEVLLDERGLVPEEERERLLEVHGADVALRFHDGPNFFCGGAAAGCGTVGGGPFRGHLDDPGFAAVHASAAAGDVAAHELGHAFGLVHSARQGEARGQFRWSRGHWGSRFGTIMSYGRGASQSEFSNPEADCVWEPCGVPKDAPDGADAVSSLSVVRFQASARRPSKTDTDGDGIVDPVDAFPEDSDEWADNDEDGVGDNGDADDDNDGINDTEDVFPFDDAEWADVDGDGIGDNADEETPDPPIRDPALLAAVERALGKAEGDGVTEEELASLEELIASAEDIGSLIGLEHATNLSRLFVSNNRIASLAPLAELSGLRTLDLLDNPLSDLSALSGLSRLESLNVDVLKRSPDLSPLSKLKGLHSLHIRGGEELPPLAGLAKLRRLTLSSTQIDDLSPLAGLVGLEFLTVAGPVRDVSVLAELNRLHFLSIQGGAIKDVAPLGSLSSLRELYLQDSFVADSTGLSALKELSILVLAGNPIRDISAFAGMRALRHLDLTGTRVKDLTPISSNRLKTLKVSRTEVTLGENAALPHAPNLDSLYASDLGIRDVSALSDLRSLRGIDLSDNLISDVSQLGSLDGLHWLVIDRNEIADLGPLVRRDLWSGDAQLDVSGNPLNKESLGEHIPTLESWGVRVTADPKLHIADAALEALIAQTVAWRATLVDSEITWQTMRQFRRLAAYGRGISDLVGLEAATGLTELYLGSNAVTDVSALSGLPLLKWVDLSDNLISDIAPLVENNNFADDDSVTLNGNPLTEESVNSHIPALLARGVHVRLDSVALTVPSGRETMYDLAGYFEARLGSGVVLTVESNDPDIASVEMPGGTLKVTTGSDEGTVSVTITATGADGESETLAVELTVAHAEPVAMFHSASDMVREGFVRVINHSEGAGIVRVDGIDDAGDRMGPVSLALQGNATAHFNSNDLENGNRGKRLAGSTGAGQGDWHLELTSRLDIEILSYVRTAEGFLTAMHDVVPQSGGEHRVAIFNPGSNPNQVSRLRLINPGAADAHVTIRGVDGKGASPGSDVEATIPAGAARTFSAADLEAGNGVVGALGDGAGKWQLTVSSDQPLRVVNLLASPSGHLTNLSTIPRAVEGVFSAPLFPPMSDSLGRQGFVRVINRGDDDAEVDVAAFDDTKRDYETLTLSVAANAVVHFNSDDLELGNAGKGLTGSTGAGEGDWRLELTSASEIEVLSYIRTTDGFLTSMHDVVTGVENRYRVAIFNPGRNVKQVSRLRLINPGDEATDVTITGIDGTGYSSGSVGTTIPPQSARSFTAADLETGTAELDGTLGRGVGKWQLNVESDRPITVMNLMESPTGHLTNLSTAPSRDPGSAVSGAAQD